MEEMETSVMADSDDGHDLVTGKSISGIIGFLVSTPIGWSSKSQPSAQSATFGADFMVLKRGFEEAVACRCYLRSFGVQVTNPTMIYEDNMSVLINSTEPSSTLQKKYITLAYHFCREQVAVGVVEIRKIHTKSNLFDALTKGLDSASYNNCFGPIIAN